jgi:putative ABC transport system permease protein
MIFIKLRIAARSLIFYSKSSVNQIIIVALLAAVITGSLLTGYSVRTSLRQKATEKLGNTGMVISSGLRLFDASLAGRIGGRINSKAVSIYESDGYIQNFSTGITALNAKIYGIGDDFFHFMEVDSVSVAPGTAAINDRLAKHLGISEGEEIIIKFRELDPLPANAPFAPDKDDNGQIVLKVGKILTESLSGNFSLGISQMVPMNAFINLSELDKGGGKSKANRLLIGNSMEYPVDSIAGVITELLTIDDIGLSIRRSGRSGEPELISDRIFIDSGIVSVVLQKIPEAWPLITYLANSMEAAGRTIPYSFVTAMPSHRPGQVAENEIMITSWAAEDVGARVGDTLKMTWFDPGTGQLLEERSRHFIICAVLDQESELADPSLMPDFPGIAGSSTCSGWDAGVPILLDKIREKDEEYWNKYRGTPKAFISYAIGREIWGNNFGPATAIRFPRSMDPEQINDKLRGSLDPGITGFKVTDISAGSIDAASSGVDFSSLFLSLSMFILTSCILLLSLAVSMFFDSRKEQIRTYYALGFRNSFIKNQLILESLVQTVAGAVPGIFLGYLINTLIINALNSVWRGAVQTDTLTPHFGAYPLVSGFVITILITGLLLLIKTGRFLRNLKDPRSGELNISRSGHNLTFLLLSCFTAATTMVLSLILQDYSTIFSFIAGALFFAAFILALRQYYLRIKVPVDDQKHAEYQYSRKYYTFNPAQAVTPAIFIAAGIFAVIITGSNRQDLTGKMLLPPGGTGGYQIWMESAVPVKEDLNLKAGRLEFGLDEPELEGLRFVQAGKLAGDDASCLNLNHVTSPPLLGLDAGEFIRKGSFSFATTMKSARNDNPWELLDDTPGTRTIYGIADQTVLQWGLKIKTGDTLKYRAENGQSLNIIVCGGLKSSVFQGHLIIDRGKLGKYFPSIAGSSVFLIDGNPEMKDRYIELLGERFSGYGVSIEPAGAKLASFFEVSNTYLDVFTVLGAFGMILGVAGMGFVLIRNFNHRKREFSLMLATGYSVKKIRRLLLNDQIIILLWGILTGSVSGLISTLPSLRSGSEIPWGLIAGMIICITAVGLGALFLAVKMVKDRSLAAQLRRE